MSCYMGLQVDPPTCPIAAEGGTSKHKLINNTDRRLAFKVRSSNNSNYTVSLVHGFVDIGKSKGKPKGDKLVFMFADVPEDATDSNARFTGNVNANGLPKEEEVVGETVVKLSAAE